MGIRQARTWYLWLWLSPVLTLPSLVLLGANFPADRFCFSAWDCGTQSERIRQLAGVLGSALWHLVLLVPALDRARPFVRWHGRQALLLAGLRTAVPLLFALIPRNTETFPLFLPIGLVLWLAGNLWGQRQAARGECSLMRWLGQGDRLDALRGSAAQVQVRALQPEALVEIIRHSRDPELRAAALQRANQLHLVETL